ncbi:MAG: translation elongation factor Ts [Candidatus Komeilibacteria bacterium]
METIKKLREQTGAGVNDCHQALSTNNNDYDLALEWLRKKGQKIANKKADRTLKAGLIDSYIHGEGKVGVLLKLGCETDFVAKNEDFKNFAHDLCLQIAATDPQYVGPEDVPAAVIAKEKEIYAENLKAENKPAEMLEKILAGKLEKFYTEVCLLKQPYIKDDKVTIEQSLTEVIAKIGENIKIDSFIRYSL